MYLTLIALCLFSGRGNSACCLIDIGKTKHFQILPTSDVIGPLHEEHYLLQKTHKKSVPTTAFKEATESK